VISFSIIICTHNPNPQLLQQLLNAVLLFDAGSIVHEIILVDNKSKPALTSNKDVKTFLAQKTESRLISQPIPGLTPSRIAGIKQAKYEWIIFFDDDNEPSTDYLNKVQSAISDYPQVGMWGPGKVDVIYTNPIDSWLEEKKHLFQQRNESATKFDKQKLWQTCYPYGTGLIVKKEVAIEYVRRVELGRYTLSDRKGKSLASGGDVQIVLTGIDMGYSAGVIVGLALNHHIDSSKANLLYLRKQEYGTASAFIKAYNEVFIDERIAVYEVSSKEVLKKIYSIYRIHRLSKSKIDFELFLASKLGELNAVVFASDQVKPFFLSFYEKMIHA
jgi:glycosyltransferase involved in cell wall biosynthesis